MPNRPCSEQQIVRVHFLVLIWATRLPTRVCISRIRNYYKLLRIACDEVEAPESQVLERRSPAARKEDRGRSCDNDRQQASAAPLLRVQEVWVDRNRYIRAGREYEELLLRDHVPLLKVMDEQQVILHSWLLRVTTKSECTCFYPVRMCTLHGCICTFCGIWTALRWGGGVKKIYCNF